MKYSEFRKKYMELVKKLNRTTEDSPPHMGMIFNSASVSVCEEIENLELKYPEFAIKFENGDKY
jgi:hypothetical protein